MPDKNINQVSEIIAQISSNFSLLGCEIIITLTIIMALLFHILPLKNKKTLVFTTSLLGHLCCLVFLILQIGNIKSITFNVLVFDSLAHFSKIILITASLMIFAFASKTKLLFKLGEYHVLTLGILLGACFLITTQNLLLIYLSIEMVSICSYLLTNFNFSKKSTEAGIKYLLFGAVSSALMLYGISLLYGITGTLDISSESFVVGIAQIPAFPMMIVILIVFSGIFFKMALFPFQSWTPDTFEAAPTPVVALFSFVPKFAVIIFFIRFYYHLIDKSLLIPYLQVLLGLVAIISIFWGNLAAIKQSNVKRMLGYSSIAHMGFLTLGILTYSNIGLKSVMFYAIIYLFINFGSFLLVDIVYSKKKSYAIDAYKGLGSQYPLIGIYFVILMIALTGLPPTAGFSAKFILLTSLWDIYSQTDNSFFMFLSLLAMINIPISLFYYLKIPYFMFFKKEKSSVDNFTKQQYLKPLLFVIPVLYFFFDPKMLLNLINNIIFVF